MKAGPLRTFLATQKPCTSDSSDNWSWVADRTIHAERIRISARSLAENNEAWADYTVRFRINCAHRVSEGWRVEERDGYLYSVVNVERYRHLGYNILICERVNL